MTIKAHDKGAVFDVFQRPKGKRKFVNRRKLGLVSRPILAGKHLAVQSFGRGKRCYCSSYERLFKTAFEPGAKYLYVPALNFYLYADEFLELAEKELQAEMPFESLELVVELGSQGKLNSQRVEGAQESFEVRVREPRDTVHNIGDEKYQFAFAAKETTQKAIVPEFKALEADLSSVLEESESPLGLFKMQQRGKVESWNEFTAHLRDFEEDKFLDLRPLRPLVVAKNKGFAPKDYTFAVEPDENYFLKAKLEDRGFVDSRVCMGMRELGEMLERTIEMEAPEQKSHLLQIVVEEKEKVKTEGKKYLTPLAPNFAELKALYQELDTRKSLKLSESQFEFGLIDAELEAMKVIKGVAEATGTRGLKGEKVGKSRKNEKYWKTEKDEKDYLLQKSRKIGDFRGKIKLSEPLVAFKAMGKMKISAKLVSPTLAFIWAAKGQKFKLSAKWRKYISQKFAFKITVAPEKSVEIKHKPWVTGACSGLVERWGRQHLKCRGHAQYTLRRMKVIKSRPFSKVIFGQIPVEAFSPKLKVLGPAKAYSHRFSDLHRTVLYVDAKVYLRRLVRKPTFVDILPGTRVKILKDELPIKIGGKCLKPEGTMEILDRVSFSPWVLKTPNFRRISKIKFLRRPFNLIVLGISRFRALRKSAVSPFNAVFKTEFRQIIKEREIKLTQTFGFGAARLGMRVMAGRGQLKAAFKEKSIDLAHVKNFIKMNHYEIKEKKVTFRTKLMPYSFGFPEFVYMPEVYNLLVNSIFLQINKQVQLAVPKKGRYSVSKSRVYRNSYSLKDPKLFMFEDASVRAQSKDYFCGKPEFAGAKFALPKVNDFKQAWPQVEHLGKLQIQLTAVPAEELGIDLTNSSRRVPLEEAYFGEKDLRLIEIRRLAVKEFDLSKLEGLEAKKEAGVQGKGAFSLASRDGDLPYVSEFEAGVYHFNLPIFKQKISGGKDFFLPLSSSRLLATKEQVINRATYRSFRFAYRPSFVGVEMGRKLALAPGGMERGKSGVELFPQIKIKYMQMGSFSMAPPIEQSFMESGYRKAKAVEGPVPASFAYEENALPQVEFIGIKEDYLTLAAPAMAGFEHESFCFKEFLKRLRHGYKFLGVNFEYLYAYLPKLREQLGARMAFVGDERGEALAMNIRFNAPEILKIGQSIEPVEALKWGPIEMTEKENLALSGKTFASRLEHELTMEAEDRYHLDLLGHGRLELEKQEHKRLPRRIKAEFAAPKVANKSKATFKFKTLGNISTEKYYLRDGVKMAKRPINRGFGIWDEVKFGPIKYSGLNYNEGQNFENDVIYKRFVILYQPPFIPDWVDLLASGPRKAMELRA